MSVWDLVAEARIREWLARSPAERETTLPPLDPALPLEVQLMQDIQQLDRMAAVAEPTEAEVMRKKASELMIRVMVLLESQGRPLAARHFAESRRS